MDVTFINNELPQSLINIFENSKNGDMYYLENMIIESVETTNKSYLCFVITK